MTGRKTDPVRLNFDRAAVVDWLRNDVRSTRDWILFARRRGYTAGFFADVIGNLQATGSDVQRGEFFDESGRRFLCFWIESNRKTLVRSLRLRRVRELDFETDENPKLARRVKRGRIQ